MNDWHLITILNSFSSGTITTNVLRNFRSMGTVKQRAGTRSNRVTLIMSRVLFVWGKVSHAMNVSFSPTNLIFLTADFGRQEESILLRKRMDYCPGGKTMRQAWINEALMSIERICKRQAKEEDEQPE